MKSVKKGESVVKEIPIDIILIDATIQPRVEQSEEIIFQYSLSLAKGDQFPPIDVFYDGEIFWLADGGHRHEAHRLEGRDSILARVFQGGRREALIHASGANVKHGLLRDNKAKHHVVENVLKDPELGLWSNNQIAEICAVSQPFVGKVRWQLTCNGFKFDSVRVSSNGRQIETANIGQKKPQATPEAQPIPRAPSSKNLDASTPQGSCTNVEPGVVNSENTVPDEKSNLLLVKPKVARVSAAGQAPSSLGKKTASPEFEVVVPSGSDSNPDGLVDARALLQHSGAVNPVQSEGDAQPNEPNYPDNTAELKRLLAQKESENQVLKTELGTKDRLIKELLAENRKLKKENEYLRDELTADATL